MSIQSAISGITNQVLGFGASVYAKKAMDQTKERQKFLEKQEQAMKDRQAELVEGIAKNTQALSNVADIQAEYGSLQTELQRNINEELMDINISREGDKLSEQSNKAKTPSEMKSVISSMERLGSTIETNKQYSGMVAHSLSGINKRFEEHIKNKMEAKK